MMSALPDEMVEAVHRVICDCPLPCDCWDRAQRALDAAGVPGLIEERDEARGLLQKYTLSERLAPAFDFLQIADMRTREVDRAQGIINAIMCGLRDLAHDDGFVATADLPGYVLQRWKDLVERAEKAEAERDRADHGVLVEAARADAAERERDEARAQCDAERAARKSEAERARKAESTLSHLRQILDPSALGRDLVEATEKLVTARDAAWAREGEARSEVERLKAEVGELKTHNADLSQNLDMLVSNVRMSAWEQARKDEREACAQIADQCDCDYCECCREIAVRIRARGQK